MEIFDQKTLQERKRRAAEAMNPFLKRGDVVLFTSGEPIQKPGGWDQTYPFLPHPDYFWLTGLRRAGGVSTYSPSEGWVDFVNPLRSEETLWEGLTENFPGLDVADLSSWMQKKTLRPLLSEEVQRSFRQARRIKDAAEVALVRRCAEIAVRGYTEIKKRIRPGISEREIQIIYESEIFKGGAEKLPYESIVGSGTNAAVLHAIPSRKIVGSGELVLVDAGVDLHDYCVDITRVFSANGFWSSQQKEIYHLVKRAQASAIAMCRPGIEWHEVHRTAARVLAEGLKDLKLMEGDTDGLLDSGAISVFFPHGVGHMVGLRVRDVGGEVSAPSRLCCGVKVRVDMPLQENFMMTVEPGLYFVKAILENKELREKHQTQIRWSAVEAWRQFGGIRIEDDILVTAKAPENLTAIVEKES